MNSSVNIITSSN